MSLCDLLPLVDLGTGAQVPSVTDNPTTEYRHGFKQKMQKFCCHYRILSEMFNQYKHYIVLQNVMLEFNSLARGMPLTSVFHHSFFISRLLLVFISISVQTQIMPPVYFYFSLFVGGQFLFCFQFSVLILLLVSESYAFSHHS